MSPSRREPMWRAQLDGNAARAILTRAGATPDRHGVVIEEVAPDLEAAIALLGTPARAPEEAGSTCEGERIVVFEAGGLVCAFVDGDVAAARVVGGERATVLELARGVALGLGRERRRRFRHVHPDGWTRHACGLFHDLRAPGATIAVPPALPLRGARPLFDVLRLEQGAEIEEVTVLDHSSITTSTGLSGPVRLVSGLLDGVRQVRGTASLADDTFLYCLRVDALEPAAASAIEAFFDVLHSIAPIPQIAAPPLDDAAFSHWGH